MSGNLAKLELQTIAEGEEVAKDKGGGGGDGECLGCPPAVVAGGGDSAHCPRGREEGEVLGIAR